MIKNIELKNFKCFKHQNIQFRPLTLLTGINSTGKSSAIQSLLLFQQSIIEGTKDHSFTLSGDLVNIGTPDDLLNSNADDDNVCISITTDIKTYDLHTTIQNNTITNCKLPSATDIFSHFFYLNAERICPKTLFPVPTAIQEGYNPIGNHGEFAAHILASHGNEKIACADASTSNLLAETAAGDSATLQLQTEAWLTKLGTPVQIQATRITGTDDVVLKFCLPHFSNIYYRPTNVGFGLTYALPIIVAALYARPGSLLIVENPEAHLHPKGQAIIGQFLSRVAACGIQVIIETHSDHILNGIRVAVKHNIISFKDVQINFFNNYDMNVNVVTPQIDADGHIDQWPDNFFDELDKLLSDLL